MYVVCLIYLFNLFIQTQINGLIHIFGVTTTYIHSLGSPDNPMRRSLLFLSYRSLFPVTPSQRRSSIRLFQEHGHSINMICLKDIHV